jgi:hypothetical protein
VTDPREPRRPHPLTIPTNPDYAPPDVSGDEAELANPVTVNNQQVLFANAALRVAQEHVEVNRRLVGARLELRVARRDFDDAMRAILKAHPPASANDTKNLKLTEAYVWRRAEENALDGALRAHERLVQAREDEVTRLEAEADNKALAMAAIKLASQNAMTFLSYVKDEARRSKYGV